MAKANQKSYRVGFMLSVKLPRTNKQTEQTELKWVNIDVFPTLWQAQAYATKEYPKFKANVFGARAKTDTSDYGNFSASASVIAGVTV